MNTRRFRESRRWAAKYDIEGSYQYMELGSRAGHEFADERSYIAFMRGSEKIRAAFYPSHEPFRLRPRGRSHPDKFWHRYYFRRFRGG